MPVTVQSDQEKQLEFMKQGLATIQTKVAKFFGYVLLLIGFLWLLISGACWWQTKSMAKWPETNAKVESANVSSSPVYSMKKDLDGRTRQRQVGTQYDLNLVVHYSIAGRDYKGRMTSAETSRDVDNRAMWMQTYAPGTELRIIYDPSDPSRIATHVPATSQTVLIMGIIGVVFFAFGWKMARRN